VPKKAQITQERVEYNVFLFDKPPKGSKSLKIFKISLTFRFEKLSNLSKSVHTGENSQILTVEQKIIFLMFPSISNLPIVYFVKITVLMTHNFFKATLFLLMLLDTLLPHMYVYIYS
jgi:hypothetical protein